MLLESEAGATTGGISSRDTMKKESSLMAEDIKKEDGDGEKLVAYKLTAPLGDTPAGTVIHLPEAQGEKLCEVGMAELATEKDMDGDGDVDEAEDEEHDEETPMVANSVKKLKKEMEKSIAGGIAKAIKDIKVPAPVHVNVPATPKDNRPVYKSVAEYVRSIARAQFNKDDSVKTTESNKVLEYQRQAAEAWKKLGVQVKAPLGINEGTNSQGGFLVNPQFSPDVYMIPHTQLDLASQCDQIEATSNVFNQRYVNESSLVNGSIFGGLNMVATAEGASFTSSLPAWSNVALTLQKFALFNYYTSEVLQDASYPIESELNDMATKVFLYGINTQIIQGSTLEGALNAPSIVTVTKSSNDTAYHTTPSTSLTYADLAGIWSRVYPDSQTSPKGMWLFHPSLTNPLVQMTYTFSGGTPAWGIQYDAQAGLAGSGPGVPPGTPYRIFGKPAYPHWACSAPGNAGDIIYIDFGTFLHYRKPFRVEVSKEFQFGTDQLAVRFIARLDCKTRFRNTVTGVSGSDTFSAIVTRTGSGT